MPGQPTSLLLSRRATGCDRPDWPALSARRDRRQLMQKSRVKAQMDYGGLPIAVCDNRRRAESLEIRGQAPHGEAIAIRRRATALVSLRHRVVAV